MFDRELVKGSTSLILLQLLAEKDMYGYEIVKEMEKRSDFVLQVKEGTLYPALHRLEKQQYIDGKETALASTRIRMAIFQYFPRKGG